MPQAKVMHVLMPILIKFFFCFVFIVGLCIRSAEIALLAGSHGPTMNVYIAKMTVPDPQTATVPSEPWPATTDKHKHPDATGRAQRT